MADDKASAVTCSNVMYADVSGLGTCAAHEEVVHVLDKI